MTRTGSLSLALLVLVLSAASGCSRGVRGVTAAAAISESDDPALVSRMEETLRGLRPAEALLTHRVILSVGERQFDMNGKLAVSRVRGLRLLALVSMGQVMMDVRILPTGETRLMREPLGMRRVWVERFVARDLRLLYQAPFATGHAAVALAGGESALTRELDEGGALRHVFDAEGSRWLRTEVVRGRTVRWIAEPLAGAGPGDLRVRDARHELTVRTLAEEPVSDPDAPGHRMFDDARSAEGRR